MILNKKFLLVFCIVVLSSCSSPQGNKKNPNEDRTENTKQVRPDSAEMINVELGVGYLKRGNEGDIDVALGKFKKAVSLNPGFALGHSMLANVYDQKGLFESAEKHYKLSIKYNNNQPDIINNYANFLCQRKKYKKAITNYMKVVDNPQYKTPASAYENAGVCAYKANNYTDSEKYFRKALTLHEKQPNSLYYLMMINMKNKKYMKARAFLQRLEQLVAPSSEILASGYQIEKELNHTKMADHYLTQLKNKFPSSQSLKNIQ